MTGPERELKGIRHILYAQVSDRSNKRSSERKKKPLSGQKTFTSRLKKKKSQNDSQGYLSRTEPQTSLVKLFHSPKRNNELSLCLYLNNMPQNI